MLVGDFAGFWRLDVLIRSSSWLRGLEEERRHCGGFVEDQFVQVWSAHTSFKELLWVLLDFYAVCIRYSE
jgi:hypothetical protein